VVKKYAQGFIRKFKIGKEIMLKHRKFRRFQHVPGEYAKGVGRFNVHAILGAATPEVVVVGQDADKVWRVLKTHKASSMTGALSVYKKLSGVKKIKAFLKDAE
jgi:hypothetical protein